MGDWYFQCGYKNITIYPVKYSKIRVQSEIWRPQIDSLVQDSRSTSALAVELLQFCSKSSK